MMHDVEVDELVVAFNSKISRDANGSTTDLERFTMCVRIIISYVVCMQWMHDADLKRYWN